MHQTNYLQTLYEAVTLKGVAFYDLNLVFMQVSAKNKLVCLRIILKLYGIS